MTIDTGCKLRLMKDNLINLSYLTREVSSELVAFPFTNVFDERRTKVFKFEGVFVIDSSNKMFYFNDGTNKSFAIDEGTYNAETLTMNIEANLNTISSGFTVSYSNYCFTVARATNFTLRFSQTNDAVWDTLGYTQSIEVSSNSQTAGEQRNHYPYELIKVDFGYDAEINFFAMIGDIAQDFGISDSATITIEANSVDDFTAPPLSKTAIITDDGAFKFFDEEETFYRYWRVKINDMFNPNGPEIPIGHFFLGTYETLEARNISRGFSHSLVDRSQITETESGVIFVDRKTISTNFSGMKVSLMDKANKDILERFYSSVGKVTPFYFSVDPGQCISDTIEKMTKYAYFEGDITFTHVFSHYFDCSFGLKEAL